MYAPIRAGTRGGQGDFKWEDVKNDAQRENYLGHSLNAPVGRWQARKDITWYNKDNKQEEEERAAEIRRIKEAEEDALSVALGFAPIVRPPPGPTPSSSIDPNEAILAAAAKEREKEERRKEKEERRSERAKKREERERKGGKERERRRSRSPRRDGERDRRGVSERGEERGGKERDYRDRDYRDHRDRDRDRDRDYRDRERDRERERERDYRPRSPRRER